jgi:3-carboxy-cis,cis-muconate cycloisomerase
MSGWFDPGFTTDSLSVVFSPEARAAAMVRFEAALAAAEAECAVIDADAAAEIAAVAETIIVDATEVFRTGWEVGSPVIPLLDQMREELSPGAAGALHRGATTQDVIDTATMLQIGEAIGALLADLDPLVSDLQALAHTHRDTPSLARTFLQPAGVTTFGLRVAHWLAPVVRHRNSLRRQRTELPIQLGGAVGTRQGLGNRGAEVAATLAETLGLVSPPSPWHGDRSPAADPVAKVAALAGDMAKIAGDLVLLSHLGEVRTRPGRSSSIAGKQNPIDPMRAVAAADVCRGAAAVVLTARPPELERGVGGWHAEWWAVPAAFQAAGAAVEATARALAELEVDPEAMAANIGGMDRDIGEAGALVDTILAMVDPE